MHDSSSSAPGTAVVVGLEAALWAMSIALLGAFPARLLLAMRERDDVTLGVQRIVTGTVLDASAVLPSIAIVVVVVALGLVLVVRPQSPRSASWQRVLPMVLATPLAFATMVLSMIAQQVNAERGAFPTAFDILESANGSFVEGVFGFLGYRHVFVPAIVTAVVALALFVCAARRRSTAVGWMGWSTGLVAGVVVVSGALHLGVRATRTLAAPLSPEALGEPLAGLIDSGLDLLRYGEKATPRQLALDVELPTDRQLHANGAAQLGWPATPLDVVGAHHPYARPLDPQREHSDHDGRGKMLLSSLQAVSAAIFANPASPPPVVFHLLLEGFRADDLHALNPAAPRALAPFVNGLYERAGGSADDDGDLVLVGRHVQQAGVRTAQGLGAMSCGLGTLPWNLSFIRDLQPFDVRCTIDVLHDAGASSSVWYGSDLAFDNMRAFFVSHHVGTVMSQAELPKGLPLGSWDAVADLALVDAAVAGVAAQVKRAPQQAHHAMVMTLSNHSPFTAPQDLPVVVKTRVEALYTQAPRAEEEDRRRLMTFSYTDAAIEHLFARITAEGLADRAVVVLVADHSTGHRYVWGDGAETDDAYGRIPLAIVVPAAARAHAASAAVLRDTLTRAQALLDEGPLSLNDLPNMVLAALSASAPLQQLPEEQRWHTLGGQVTSPHFRGFVDGAVIEGINGVSQVVAFDANSVRLGEPVRAKFLQSSADRYRSTPALFPIAAPLQQLLLRSSSSSTSSSTSQP